MMQSNGGSFFLLPQVKQMWDWETHTYLWLHFHVISTVWTSTKYFRRICTSNQNEMEIKNKRSQEFCHMRLGGQTPIPCLQPQWGRIAAGWHKGKLFVNLAFLRECLLRQVWLTLAELCLDIYNYKKLMRLQYN